MDIYKIQNKVVLITGAATGIGAGIVKAFLDEGARHVAILDVAESAGLILCNELNHKHGNGSVRFFKCDVTDENGLFNAFEETFNNEKSIDVVINNAGIMNDERNVFKKEIDINVTAVITGTHKAIELMRKDKGGNGGTIINISSIAGLSQTPYMPVYYATKSAVLQFGMCAGMEPNFSRTGVRVLTVCFGATATSLLNATNASFDDTLHKELDVVLSKIYKQKLESAVRGVVEGYKKGSSGSTWLADNDEAPEDITEKVKNGYLSMYRYKKKI